MQHDDTPHKHDGTLPSDGGMKVLEGSTTVLCTDGDVSISERLYILCQTCQGCNGAMVPAAVQGVVFRRETMVGR